MVCGCGAGSCCNNRGQSNLDVLTLGARGLVNTDLPLRFLSGYYNFKKIDVRLNMGGYTCIDLYVEQVPENHCAKNFINLAFGMNAVNSDFCLVPNEGYMNDQVLDVERRVLAEFVETRPVSFKSESRRVFVNLFRY